MPVKYTAASSTLLQLQSLAKARNIYEILPVQMTIHILGACKVYYFTCHLTQPVHSTVKA